MSLRSLIKNKWWWAVVLVLWAFAFLGVFQVREGINWGFPIAIMVTLLILVAKAVEYLTRPAQTAQQAVRHTTRRGRVERLEKKNSNYGLVIAVIIGLALFSLLVYILSIIGAIVYFITFYLLERYYERKNRLLYYTGYYALRVGAVIVIIAIILFFMFALGIFSTAH